MQQYKDLVKYVLDNGIDSGDRTGTGTKSVFGYQMRFDLQKGFPLVTLKRTYWKGVLVELLWLMRGETNVKFLQDRGVKIWDEWSRFDGIYPSQKRLIGEVEIKDIQGDEYFGNFSTKGLNAPRNSLDDKLRNVWIKMMKRCYDKNSHNYHQYGEKGVMVSKEWHDPRQFIEDAKKLTNWENKIKNWNSYELDKDYYQSHTYSKECCVWLHTSENNLYTKNFNPFEMFIGNKKYLCMSFCHASEMTGISKSSIHRWANEGKSSKCDIKYRNMEVRFNFKVKKNLRYLFTNGDLGPVYGEMWRNWKYTEEDAFINLANSEDKFLKERYGLVYENESLDQLTNVIERIKTNPNCRRLIVSAWNAGQIHNMALPPCHAFYQFYVRDGKLSCQLYQRSADVFLGVPFNIASYAALTHLVANECGLEVGDFIHTFGDAHIYNNHIDQCKEILKREPMELPTLEVNIPAGTLMHFIDHIVPGLSWEEIQRLITLNNYKSHPAIKGEVSV